MFRTRTRSSKQAALLPQTFRGWPARVPGACRHHRYGARWRVFEFDRGECWRCHGWKMLNRSRTGGLPLQHSRLNRNDGSERDRPRLCLKQPPAHRWPPNFKAPAFSTDCSTGAATDQPRREARSLAAVAHNFDSWRHLYLNCGPFQPRRIPLHCGTGRRLQLTPARTD